MPGGLPIPLLDPLAIREERVGMYFCIFRICYVEAFLSEGEIKHSCKSLPEQLNSDPRIEHKNNVGLYFGRIWRKLVCIWSVFGEKWSVFGL